MRELLLSLAVAALATAAPAAERQADWCTVRSPDDVRAGDTLVVEVDYRGIEEPLRIFADLHYNRAGGEWAGKMARGGAFGTIQGNGKATLRLVVPRNAAERAESVFAAIFITPKGWDERVDGVNSPPTRVLQPEEEQMEPVSLVDGYAQDRPRLLFGAGAREALQQKMEPCPELWQPVLRQARGLTSYVPDREAIREGTKYWRAEWIFSGALAWWLTGNDAFRDAATNWMLAHCREDTWGTGYRPNVDLAASWYLYYISLAYDLLHASLEPAERGAIASGLADHARALYEARPTGRTPYDQNHTYIPTTALATAALALMGEVPEAEGWLAHAADLMARCRAVLPDDGYYYEGTGYWEYAVHWHVRYADLMTRATGRDLHDLPFFRKNHLFPLYLGLPGAPFAIDIGDTGRGAEQRATKQTLGRKAILYRWASVFEDGTAQAIADRIRREAGPASDDPAMTFLWYDPSVEPAELDELPTFHVFEDFGVLSWRSSWEPDATVCVFKCGPPLGYDAAAKLEAMPSWGPNPGHVHPDIGMYWIYARGAYLATDTGYTARKKTRDHNTILVDGQGMGLDRSYWIYNGFPDHHIPYSTWTPARLEKVHAETDYAYALGVFSSVYPEELGPLTVRRHFVCTRDFQLVYDELGGRDRHVFTAMLHADDRFEKAGPNVYTTTTGTARLGVHVLLPAAPTVTTGPALCFDWKGSPNTGEEEARGYELAAGNAEPSTDVRLLTVLVPQAKGREPARVELVSYDEHTLVVDLHSPGEAGRRLTLDLDWQPQPDPGGGPLNTQ